MQNKPSDSADRNAKARQKYLDRMSDPMLGDFYRAKHRARVLAASRRRKEKSAAYMKAWRGNNESRSDSDYIARHVSRCLKYHRHESSIHPSFDYDISKLVAHIERKFEDGMSWSNYGRGIGKWHIDHIKPVTSFDFTQPNALQECWSLSNLRPLWAVENLAQKPGRSLGLPLAPTPSVGDQLTLVPA